VKIYISFDMEGVAGIVDWAQCIGDGPAYDMGVRLTLAEVNAAIDGAMEAGVDEIVVNDAHWRMQNLAPDQLHGGATYVSGRHKPLYMMEGLDPTFEAIFFVGYHGSISGESSVLSHTYNPDAVADAELNGIRVGESGINALVARGHSVPIAMITGDRQTAEESEKLMPGADRVIVKQSITRHAAQNLHPEEARTKIREGARRAIENLANLKPPQIDLPARLEVWFHTADQAEIASWIKGVERTELRSVVIEGDDPIATYRAFVGAIYLTRAAEGR
jgi:D-amino peptidase